MIEASAYCKTCGHELSVCVCDDRAGAFQSELQAALARFTVRVLLCSVAVLLGAMVARCFSGTPC